MIKISIKTISGKNSKPEKQITYLKDISFLQITENEDPDQNIVYIQATNDCYARVMIKDIKSGQSKIEIYNDKNTGNMEEILRNRQYADYGMSEVTGLEIK